MPRTLTPEPPRPDCPAPRHDTERAMRVHGCLCPAGREKARQRQRRHDERRRGSAAVDPVVVAHLVAGARVKANRRTVAAAIAELERRTVAPDGSRRRWYASEIAERVGCTRRTVQRHRMARRRREGEPECPT